MKKSLRFVCAVGFLLLIIGCNNRTFILDKQECPIDQLLLNHSDYPPGTTFDSIDSPIAEKPKESVGQSTYFRDSWMDEMVIRYPSTNRVSEIFNERQRSIFHANEVYGGWEVPPELNLNDLSASQYKIACGNVIGFGERCYMIGQYEKYYVFFRADISNNGVTYEMFRNLVLKIDDRVSACINP